MNRFERMDGPFPVILRDIEDRNDPLFFHGTFHLPYFPFRVFILFVFLLVFILKAFRIRRFFRDSFLSNNELDNVNRCT